MCQILKKRIDEKKKGENVFVIYTEKVNNEKRDTYRLREEW